MEKCFYYVILYNERMTVVSNSEIEKVIKLGKKKNLKKLQKYFATDQDADVVEAVFEAIGNIANPDAVAALCKEMHSENVSVRMMAAKALTVAAKYPDIEKLRHFADVETEPEIKTLLAAAALKLKASAPKDDLDHTGTDY
jgi:hypothetical protein